MNELIDEISKFTIGIDEVGRGCLSGPVVACSILLKKTILTDPRHLQIVDSKTLSIIKREKLAHFIKQHSVFNFGLSSVSEIEKNNILIATKIAMLRSFNNFYKFDSPVKIDGPKFFELTKKTEFIINGDKKSRVIAAASIVAKSFRDQLMNRLSKKFPQYNWKNNKGYGTKEHIKMIEKFGVTKYHRKTFEPIKSMQLNNTR
ncbi:MAG: ribonuclease HII [Rickettsiales bacterium]|nr:ribonuclease HII [Rickettsiales bacterium]OUV53230.1 MAG: ribonuclease HII [Rickettsiales bacterium TMED127]|tara:strand:- start:58666 stop:59274 length:609 start_codon:yes stop_codon:yes gene_type:complete